MSAFYGHTSRRCYFAYADALCFAKRVCYAMLMLRDALRAIQRYSARCCQAKNGIRHVAVTTKVTLHSHVVSAAAAYADAIDAVDAYAIC